MFCQEKILMKTKYTIKIDLIYSDDNEEDPQFGHSYKSVRNDLEGILKLIRDNWKNVPSYIDYNITSLKKEEI